VKNPAGNDWHPSVVVPTVPPGEPGKGSVDPSFASFTLAVKVDGDGIGGLNAAGSAALLPPIAGGELIVRAAFVMPLSTMFATLMAAVELAGLLVM
jgi:hypothetical protein